MNEKYILIVEDEKPISDILKFNLEKEGYKAKQAFDGEEGLNLAKKEDFDLVLLDVMLPKMDGFQVLRELRSVKKNIPILLVTAREDEIDKVLGLELGADDYITKPYSVRELIARVKANLRRTISETFTNDEENSNIIKMGRLIINSERYEVTKDSKPIDLTRREFELLEFLAKKPEKIFSREALLEQVWGYEYLGDVRTVDVTVRRLREKIEDNSSEPEYVVTKRGLGYYFKSIK
ncbi:MAG: response regulator transcription factor [Ruminococcaceae bacterium]|nr:response regulator transcription factor [Oscillospiraceae bacterium]